MDLDNPRTGGHRALQETDARAWINPFSSGRPLGTGSCSGANWIGTNMASAADGRGSGTVFQTIFWDQAGVFAMNNESCVRRRPMIFSIRFLTIAAYWKCAVAWRSASRPSFLIMFRHLLTFYLSSPTGRTICISSCPGK
jgi:hypothetical protein